MEWLKKLFSGNAKTQADPLQDEAWQKKCDEIGERLDMLFAQLRTDRGTSVFVAQFAIQAQREIMSDQPTRFSPDDSIDHLAAEAALQGFLDPQGWGARSRGVVQDDALMAMMIHFAQRGDESAARAVRYFAVGRLKRRSAG
ncbi:MAG: hypothetical protein QGI33_07475, partial [Candidatus Brocadiia bacterium]|nr:hypothetical protein [Candidatus Brocadiia bacterium]